MLCADRVAEEVQYAGRMRKPERLLGNDGESLVNPSHFDERQPVDLPPRWLQQPIV
jgi:hypothetical protein